MFYGRHEYLNYWKHDQRQAIKLWEDSHDEICTHRMSYFFRLACKGNEDMANAWNVAWHINRKTFDPFRHCIPTLEAFLKECVDKGIINDAYFLSLIHI